MSWFQGHYFYDDLSTLMDMGALGRVLKVHKDLLQIKWGIPQDTQSYNQQEVIRAAFYILYWQRQQNPQKRWDQDLLDEVAESAQMQIPENPFRLKEDSTQVWGGAV